MTKKKTPTFEYEIKHSIDKKVIAGVDEVGRGALAGPIVTSAVVFEKYENIINHLSGINDSKILSPTKRLEYDELIKSKASDFAIGIVEACEIDKYGIGSANVMAFQRALKGLKKCDFVLIDGRRFRGLNYEYVCLEKGESKSISIAAASIIAKVYRDALMQEIHDEVFRYDFASNKGYGSKSHMEALEKFGPCKHHRKTFLNKFNNHVNQGSLF
ncbi:MAG: ribonuclease HII [Patescibacteria group bacterium]